MKTYRNVTLALDERVYQHARICAAWRDTSISNLVREFLKSLETVPECPPMSRRNSRLKRLGIRERPE